MKIQNISTPIVMNYYFSKSRIEEIIQLLQGEFCYESENKLYITLDFNALIDESLRLYKSKTEKITAGNCYLYEYEIPTQECKDDKVFVIRTEDGKFFKCALEASNINDKTMIIYFKIIK